MATDVVGMPNGTYAPHQAYAGVDQNGYGYSNTSTSQPATQQPPPASSTPSNAQNQPSQPEISKDEVGWYFVEQYYTTLSRSPEKLYLFYNKRSQLVSGQETDKVQVCIGQRAINDKIRDLDFQDCKVRVTNVDSQSSDSNIVIQVIGEISNKSQPHRKFTQTFVLATQTNGYFVLNDIFRYLVDEEEEPEAEAASAPAEEVQQAPDTESGSQEPPPADAHPKTLTTSADPVAVEHDTQEIDKNVEEKKAITPVTAEEPITEKTTNGEAAQEEVKAAKVPVAPAQVESVSVAKTEGASAEQETPSAPVKPKDTEPIPTVSPAKQTTTQAVPASKPAAPAAPMTWAGRVAAANKVATPAAPPVATPAVKPSTPTSAKSATPAAAQPTITPATPTAPAVQRQDTPDSQDDWATVGHNRQQSRQTNTQQPEQPQYRGYIKNVLEDVDQNELRKVLEEDFGELIYLDIARQKNCAFVDFKTAESYNKATSTPFQLGNGSYQVEERRFKPGSTPYIPRGNFQGGRGRGGAGGQGAPRGGGAFANNRGNGAPRGGGRGTFPQRGGRGGTQT